MAADADIQARVLADADADPSLGYKRLAKRHNLPAETVRDWVRAHRAGRKPPAPNARTRARAQAPAPVPPPSPDPDWDPATCTDREFLEESLRQAKRHEAAAIVDHHGGVARQWAETAMKLRDRLADFHREDAERAAEEAKRRNVAPEELCTRVIAVAPVLARVVPEATRNLIAALQAALPRE